MIRLYRCLCFYLRRLLPPLEDELLLLLPEDELLLLDELEELLL